MPVSISVYVYGTYKLILPGMLVDAVWSEMCISASATPSHRDATTKLFIRKFTLGVLAKTEENIFLIQKAHLCNDW